MCFLLAFKRIVKVGWNRREEQAADELKRINHVNGWFFLLCFYLVQGSRFRGEVAAAPLFLLGRCPEVAFKSTVTSHSYDTREGIVSHVWHEILRLSPHLFWLGVFTHGAFSSAQNDDTRRRKGSHLGDTLHVLELAVLYYYTSSPLEKGRAKGAGWIHTAV